MSTHKHEPSAIARLYSPSATQPEIVDVPAMNFLMVDGRADPNHSELYKDAIETLYALSYTLKYTIKDREKVDYQVSLLEGLWWSDAAESFLYVSRDAWRWTLMVRQPTVVTSLCVEQAIEDVRRKKTLAALSGVRLETLHEGVSAQILHIGASATAASTVRKLHEFIDTQGGVFEGRVQKHHEIYLGDPRRAALEKPMTVIRQPFMHT